MHQVQKATNPKCYASLSQPFTIKSSDTFVLWQSSEVTKNDEHICLLHMALQNILYAINITFLYLHI